ncbi:Protein of unknown function [Microbacterium sp. 77mftsu3.1]|nr:Protein of unknown function [Microbacterium sp. 77mftsu3.1]
MSPSNFTVADDFYVTREDGVRNTFLEEWFSREVETPASKILSELDDGDIKFTADTMLTLVRFLTAQAYRTEPALATLNSPIWARMAERYAPITTLTHGGNPVAAGRSLKSWAQELGRLALVRNLDFTGAYQSSAYRVHNSRWRLFRFSQPALITSDDPVSIQFDAVPQLPLTDFLGASFWYMPLSPTLAAVMYPDRDPRHVDQGLVTDLRIPQLLNMLTIRNPGAATFVGFEGMDEASLAPYISGERRPPKVDLTYREPFGV